MSNKFEFRFPEFDTSCWETKDKIWMAQRAANWPVIEKMIRPHKPARALSVIKQYYMKGKLPDWDRLRDWDNRQRHLDLFLFLWLHPSNDNDFLTRLRDQYIGSKVVTQGDVSTGYGIFFRHAIKLTSQPYTDEQVDQGWTEKIIISGDNEFYFDVLMEGIEYITEGVEFLHTQGQSPEIIKMKYPAPDFMDLQTMSDWLCIDPFRAVNEDMLYQYDRPLAWWYSSRTQDEDYFKNWPHPDELRAVFRTALYRVHNFDCEAEGNTGRTRLVLKLRKMLDERPFIKELEFMWEQVKHGQVCIEDPFNYFRDY